MTGERIWLYDTTLRGGRASGPLVGGNLAVLTSLSGTPYMPSFDGAILFLEDVTEYIYRVDRMLSTLLLSGALSRVAGVVRVAGALGMPPNTLAAAAAALLGRAGRLKRMSGFAPSNVPRLPVALLIWVLSKTMYWIGPLPSLQPLRITPSWPFRLASRMISLMIFSLTNPFMTPSDASTSIGFCSDR
mgnify:CR=1 FL=1